MALPCGELSGRVERRVSRLPQELRGAYAVPRVPTPGLPSPGKPISRDFRRAPPQTTNQSDSPRRPHPGAWGWAQTQPGVGDWEEGGSQRKLPAAPSRATRSGRDQPPPARGRGQQDDQCEALGGWGGAGGARRKGLERAGGADRREGARAGSGRSGSRSFLGISRHFSITASPTTAVPEPRSRPPTHSQFLNQHHLPGSPSQLPPLPPPPPPPPLPPLTAPARPRLPAPASPHSACASTPFRRDPSRQRARGASPAPVPRPTLGARGLQSGCAALPSAYGCYCACANAARPPRAALSSPAPLGRACRRRLVVSVPVGSLEVVFR